LVLSFERLQYEIRSRHDRRLVALAETLMVFINERGKPTAIPEKLTAILK